MQWSVRNVENQVIHGAYVVTPRVAKITEDVVLHGNSSFIRTGQSSFEFGREDCVVTVASVDAPIDDDGGFAFLVGFNTTPRRYSIR